MSVQAGGPLGAVPQNLTSLMPPVGVGVEPPGPVHPSDDDPFSRVRRGGVPSGGSPAGCPVHPSVGRGSRWEGQALVSPLVGPRQGPLYGAPLMVRGPGERVRRGGVPSGGSPAVCPVRPSDRGSLWEGQAGCPPPVCGQDEVEGSPVGCPVRPSDNRGLRLFEAGCTPILSLQQGALCVCGAPPMLAPSGGLRWGSLGGLR